MKFTKTKIDQLELPPGKTDHIEWDDELPGFGLRIRESGAKYYIAQYRIGSKQGRETIGKAAAIEVDAARKKARAILELAELGRNPKAVRQEDERKIAQAITPLIDRFLLANKSGWSPKYHADNQRALKVYFKRLHAKALTEIQRSDVADELAAIQRQHGDTTRNRARAALSSFFNWAIGEGLCDHNPVEKTNKAPEVARDRELSKSELRRLWNAVEGDGFTQDERDVIRLMILTLQREGQIGDLKVSEIDLKDKRLTYPRGRVKNKVSGKHVVPLAPLAYAILAERDLEGRQFVFGKWDSGFANYTHLKERIDEIVKFNEGWVFHDLRRTGKTAMSEHLEVMGEVSEAILNHGKRDMDRVYNNAQYIRQKLAALSKWETYVTNAIMGIEQRQAA